MFRGGQLLNWGGDRRLQRCGRRSRWQGRLSGCQSARLVLSRRISRNRNRGKNKKRAPARRCFRGGEGEFAPREIHFFLVIMVPGTPPLARRLRMILANPLALAQMLLYPNGKDAKPTHPGLTGLTNNHALDWHSRLVRPHSTAIRPPGISCVLPFHRSSKGTG